MKILKIEPEKAPYVKEIENELHAIQEEVGGDMEVVGMEPGVILCCNEEGKFNGMEPNRKVPGDIILRAVLCGRRTGRGFCFAL